MALTIFALDLLLSLYKFATYLQGANLCKSIFSSSDMCFMKMLISITLKEQKFFAKFTSTIEFVSTCSTKSN